MTDRIRIEVEGDTRDLQAAVAAAATSIRGLGVTTRRESSRIGTDVERSSRRISGALVRPRVHATSLGNALLRLRLIAAALTFEPAIKGLSALTSMLVAVTAAVAPAVGGLAALPSVLSAIAQGASVTALATQGVGDAIKASLDKQAAATKDSTAALNSHQQSVERVRNAKVALTRAHEEERRATTDLGAAVRDARREYEDLERAAKRSADTERNAVLAVREAQRELRRLENSRGGDVSQFDLVLAEERVNDARNALSDTRLEARRARQDFRLAERRGGVEAMPQVVAAHERIRDAQEQAAEAAHDLAVAQRQATVATSAQSAAVTKQQEALEKLSPAARRFVDTVLELKPAYDEIRETAAEGFFPGAERGLRDAMRLRPLVDRLVRDTARVMGGMAAEAGARAGSPRWQRDLAVLGRRNVETLERMGDAGFHVAEAMRHVMVEADPLIDWLTRSAVLWARNTEEEARAGRQTGELAAFFDRTRFALERLFSISGNVAGAIGNIFRAGREDGQHYLTSLDRITGKFEEWTGSLEGQNALKRWFADGRETMRDVAEAIRDIRDRVRELKEDGESTGDALIIALAEALSKAIGETIESLAKRAPAIAEGFVRGFLGANAWGKLAIGTWLIAKMGGVGAARTAGGKIGAAVMAGMAGAFGAGKLGQTALEWVKDPKTGGLIAGGAAAPAAAKGARGVAGKIAGALAAPGTMPAKPLYVWVVNQGGGGKPGGGKPGGGGAKPPPFAAVGGLAVGAAPFLAVDQIADEPSARGRGNLFRKHGPGLAQSKRDHDNWAKGVKKSTKDVSDAYERTGSIQTTVMSKSARDLADLRVKTARETERIKTRFAADTKEGRDALARNYREAADAAKTQMERSGRVTKDGLDFIRRMMIAELRLYGLNPRQALNISKGDGRGGQYGDPDANRGREGGAQSIIRDARGGLHQFGRAGQQGRDSILARIAGENVMVGPGEVAAVFTGHQQAQLDAELAHYGGLHGFISAVNRPHYMAKGGIVGVPGSVGTSVDRRILRDVVALRDRYRLGLGDGYATSGHAADGEHPLGLAIDAVPGVRGSWDLVDALARWAEPAQNRPRDPFRWVGYDGDANHGRGHHIHLSWQHGPGFPAAWVRTLGGKVLGQMFGSIRRVKVGGPDSPLKSVAQGALDRVRKAANRHLTNVLSTDMSGGGEFSGSFTGDWVDALEQIAAERGWSASDWKWVVNQESSGVPGVYNKDGSGAFGLGQLMPGTYAAHGGGPGSTAVEQIYAMASYIAGRYGSPTAARSFWEQNGWYGRGGMLRAARGVVTAAKGVVKKRKRPKRRDELQNGHDPTPYGNASPDDLILGLINPIQDRLSVREMIAATTTPLDFTDDLAVYRDAEGTWKTWFDIAMMNNAPQSIIRIGGLLASARDSIKRIEEMKPDTDDSTSLLLQLTRQQLDDTRRALAVSDAQFDVFKGMLPLVGSFSHGGTLPRTGLYFGHQGEHVTPAPDGPYPMMSRGTPADRINVTVNIRGGDGLSKPEVEVLVEGKLQQHKENIERRSRTLARAPGRP